MKKIITIFLVFFATNLLTADFEFDGGINFDKPYLFLSLGCNCWQAQALRTHSLQALKSHSLRDAAFPFDWLFTLDNDCLIKCLDEKFKHFFDESCFIRCSFDPQSKLALRQIDLVNTRYNFIFTHDWPYHDIRLNKERHQGQLEFIKNKYSRRIARFDSLRNYKGKVFFMRCFASNPNDKHELGWNAQNAINLNNSLKRFFPELNFTLVIVSRSEQAISEIGLIDGIKEYKIANLTDFKTYDTMFSEILKEFIPHV